jgi:hypothetical protein
VAAEGAERSEGTSHTNSAEADVVAQVVRGFLASGELRPDQVGVVTPYASQVRLLRRILNVPRRAPADGSGVLEVSSVDGFQGREKEVIVFSAVRANAGGAVGFLGDPRRLNVMLTRAKRGLVVVGHHRTLSSETQFWQPWLRWAEGAGLVHGAAARDPAAVAHLLALDIGPGGVRTLASTHAVTPAVWAVAGPLLLPDVSNALLIRHVRLRLLFSPSTPSSLCARSRTVATAGGIGTSLRNFPAREKTGSWGRRPQATTGARVHGRCQRRR